MANMTEKVTSQDRIYYVCKIIGSGRDIRDGNPLDALRPSVSQYCKNYGMIRHPDKHEPGDYCIAYTHGAPEITNYPDIQIITKGDALDGKIRGKAKNLLESELGLNLTDSTLVDYLIALLGSKATCQDGNARIYFGGQIFGSDPVEYEKRSYWDDFNRANQNGLGTSSQGWVWNLLGASDFNINNNRAEGKDLDNSRATTASPLTSINHYVQAVQDFTATGAGGLCVRGITTAVTFYLAVCAITDWQILEVTAGIPSVLATEAGGYSHPSGETCRFEADGSGLVYKQGGVTKLATSDSTLTGLYSCIYFYTGTACYWDNFQTDILVPRKITSMAAKLIAGKFI